MANKIQARNNFVFIKRDEVVNEMAGLIIPGQGREKPHEGTIVSAGPLVEDPAIKNGKGKKAIFHKGIGFEIDIDGETFLVLLGGEIIGTRP